VALGHLDGDALNNDYWRVLLGHHSLMSSSRSEWTRTSKVSIGPFTYH